MDVSELEALLKPFEEVTKMFCQDSAPISLQFPIAKMIHSKLFGIEVSSSLTAYKEKMTGVLEEKFFALENDR